MNKHVESITGVVAVKRLVKVVCIAGAAIMLAGCGSDATTEAVDSAQSDEATSEVETVEDGNVESTDDAQVDGEPTEDTAPETVPPVTADDIPVAHTPPGGYGDIMPAPVLSSCTEPLSDEAVDMRGMWQIVGPENEGDAPTGAVQRIEQCGNRMVITSGGAVHDMRVDGTLDNGVNDVAARDFTTPARVAAFWEDGVHVLRPDGLPIEVTRHLDGDQLIWRYFDFSARLDRIGPVDMEVDALDPPQSDVATSEVDAVDSATVEGANAQVLYHDSYWVTEVEVPNSPDVNVINDMYVDLDTMRVTVYAQTRVLVDRIVAPPQVDPGECTDTLLGDRVCHHPDAVYLNGSGQELETSDGTGEWWVKHSWILGGEGYDNCPLESAEVYENCFYVEGELMDDGVSMRIGGIEPGFEDFFNVRGPVLDRSPIEYQVRRHEPAEDGSGPVETFTLTWQCEEAVSAFDGSDRTCRDS